MMKNYAHSIISKITGFLIINVLLSFGAAAQYSWQYVGDYDGFYSLYDANHFCIKDGFTAQFTQDGGTNFTTLDLATNQILAVQYLSTSEIMALTSAGGSLELFKSTDGGTNFTSQGLVLDPAFLGLNNREFFFIDANTGFIFNQVMYDGDLINVLFKTSNGGQNWSVVQDTTAFDVSDYMYFDKQGNIFAVGKMPTTGLYVSNDFGTTFTALGGSLPNYTSGVKLAYDGNQTYMANGIIGSSNSCCYISTDGGATFSTWSASSSGGTSLAFNSPSHVLVFGTSDTTALSTDNGASFNTVRFGVEKPSGSFYFIGSGDNDQSFYVHDGNAKLWVYDGSSVNLNELDDVVELNVFPNPTTSFIRIELPESNQQQFSLMIHDLQGKRVIEEELTSVDPIIQVENLKQGVYIIQVFCNEFAYPPARFVKQ